MEQKKVTQPPSCEIQVNYYTQLICLNDVKLAKMQNTEVAGKNKVCVLHITTAKLFFQFW